MIYGDLYKLEFRFVKNERTLCVCIFSVHCCLYGLLLLVWHPPHTLVDAEFFLEQAAGFAYGLCRNLVGWPAKIGKQLGLAWQPSKVGLAAVLDVGKADGDVPAVKLDRAHFNFEKLHFIGSHGEAIRKAPPKCAASPSRTPARALYL